MIDGVSEVRARIEAIESRFRSLSVRNFDLVLRSVSPGIGAVDSSGMVGVVPVNPGDEEKCSRLNSYMQSRNFNPGLAARVGTFVAAAEKQGMDWRLGVVLATVESSGGRDCFRPHNPFGIMGKSFGSWEEAVVEVNRLVASYGFGNDPEKILSKYNPAGGQTYINNVLREMNSI